VRAPAVTGLPPVANFIQKYTRKRPEFPVSLLSHLLKTPLRSAALAAGLTPLRGLPLIYRAALKPSHHPPIYDRFSYPRLAASFGAPLDARDAGGAVPRRGMVLRGDLALRPSRPTVTEARSALHAPSLLLST
jgi:hypothetical protein